MIFYALLIIFWIDVYPNIILLPINNIVENLSPERFMGWPFVLLNGEYYFSREVPSTYILVNLT